MKKIVICLTSIVLCFGFTGCGAKKEILKLGNELNIGSLEDDSIINEKKTNIEISNLPETKVKVYEKEEFLNFVVDYIKKEFNTIIDDNWTYYIHYYNDEKSVGSISFNYNIGEIETNKSLTFNIENDSLNIVYYKMLDKVVDEDSLLKRLENFKNTYTQEKIKLKKNQEFISEEKNYSYYYNVDKFVYTYVVFFSDGLEDERITSSSVTSYLID